ncbi:MAG TPA: 50S ribosomal protein L4 [Syntrophobacteraceae bacterium]|jgi:large subunit ribosomal protein L4|nr:50S ribosomal protein L4 [Syntrophobacteraceae bacterium]HBD07900.1 50S ribosomal protein L4 [Syntrophobacteraceae bacterium]HBZ56289.1 50S ribosomal protein L4 [Syntrophobacteraceae bacterium]
MPTVDIYSMDREIVGQRELREDVFAVAVKPHILHEVVVYQLAKRRAGTVATKGRSEVAGGGRKPWKQKGTGRARAGTTRSPLWRGGGTVHGPQPRDYCQRVPKKVRRMALKMALTQKVLDQQMTVLDELRLEQIKTKDFAAFIHRFELDKTLVVLGKRDDVIEKSARNLRNIKVLRAEGLNVYDLINYPNVLVTQETIGVIEEALQS